MTKAVWVLFFLDLGDCFVDVFRHCTPGVNSTLPGTSKANPEGAKAHEPLPGGKRVIRTIGYIGRSRLQFSWIFRWKHSVFFGVGSPVFFWYKKKHGSPKILALVPTTVFGNGRVSQSLKEQSTFQKTYRFSSKRAQEGRRWVLKIRLCALPISMMFLGDLFSV